MNKVSTVYMYVIGDVGLTQNKELIHINCSTIVLDDPKPF